MSYIHSYIHTVSILICFLCSSIFTSAHAQSKSDTVSIFFRPNSTAIERGYKSNGHSLDDFASEVIGLYNTPGHRVYKVSIISGASPDGPTDRNEKLSRQRAESIRSYLINNIPQLPPNMFVIKSAGEDWESLLRYVRESYDIPLKDQVIDIILNTPIWVKKDGVIVDGRKRQLQNLGGGVPWNWMLINIFPKLRQSTAQIDYNVEELPGYKPQEKKEEEDVPRLNHEIKTYINIGHIYVNPAPSQGRDTVYIKESPQPREKTPFGMVIKTNLLYDAVIIPNIGIEIGIANGVVLSGNYENIWLRDKDLTRWYRIEGFDAGIKWYINKEKRPFRGNHIEIYGQMLTWDITYKGIGYMTDRWAYGGGVAYGYALPIGKRLSLDFEIGIGYLRGEMNKYIPQDGHRVWQSLEQFEWFGPTKGSISLQFLIGRENKHDRRAKK